MQLSEIERKRKRLEQVGSDAARTQGELDAVLKSLNSQFGVPSLDAARKRLRKMERERSELEEELAGKEEAFRERWGEKLS